MKDECDNQAIPFPARLLTGALVLTGVVLVATAWFAFDSHRSIATAQLRDLRVQELRGAIVHLDEVLTMSAHMAATTGDSAWERRYRQFEPQLNAAIKEAMELTAHSDSAQAAAQTEAANLKLVEMENRGFALVRAGDAGQAKAVLFSDAYEAQKKIYAGGMVKLIQHLKDQLTANQRKAQREAFLSIIAVALCIAFLLFTWLSVLRRLKYWRTMQSASLAALTQAEEALRKLNDGLEKRVEDRTLSLQLEIRERKEAEAALLESEARKNAIVQSSLDCIVAIDHEGKILEFNPAAEKVFGYARAEVLGRELAQVIIPPSLRERHRQGMARYLATGQARVIGKRIEINAIRSDGSEFPVELAITRMGAQEPPTFTGFLRDISERKRVEWQLNIQHAISRVLAESSTPKEASARILQIVCENLKWDVGEFWNVDRRAGVLRFDEMWIAPNICADDFVMLSRQITFARGVGLPGRVWESGKPVWVPDVAVDANFPRVAAAKQVGLHGAFSVPIVAGNEVVGVVEFFSREIRQPDEELLRMFAVLGSQLGQFFERKLAEEALRDSDEKFRQLAENITDVIWMTSPDMQKFDYISPAYERVWGRSVASLHADPHQWAEAILPEERERVFAAFTGLTADNSSVSVEYRISRPDGTIRWLHDRGFVVRNTLGKVIRHTGIATDITDLKRAEAELKKTHRELLETSRRAGMAEVATSVLHNVGNVLNSVNVSTTLVAEQVKKSKVANLTKAVALMNEHLADLGAFMAADPKGKQLPGYLTQLASHLAAEQTTVLKEMEQLQKNIEHIKDIVAMQQSYAKVSGVTETLRISDLIEDALRMNVAALTRHEVEVVREFAEVAPVTIDKHKVLQVLVNLIRNAKYACDDSGRPDKRVTVRVANGEGRLKIAIIDNGVGIPAENLIRIFNHGFTTRKDGHGFGLHSGALAAKEMGGSLVVHSEGPGRGASFTLELPVERGPGGI
jgi:PAS domain S-box-containing protein